MTRSSVDLEEAGPAGFEELRVRDCSIKRTLDVVGENWTLLVLREAFAGARRFEQFVATDPYVQAGLVTSWEVNPWRLV